MNNLDDERKKWIELVERNVPNIVPDQTRRIVNAIMIEIEAGIEPNFWHAVSVVQNRLDQCPCSPCTSRRWGSKPGGYLTPS